MVDLLERYGSVEYARSTARELILEARSYLGALQESRARDVLESMADFFLERRER